MGMKGWGKQARRRTGSKMGNIRSTSTLPEIATHSFASKLERNRAVELVLLQRAKKIRKLKFHPVIHLTRAGLQYTPDAEYEEPWGENWRHIYEECKGMEMYPWMTYKKLWPHYGPGWLRIIRDGGGGKPKWYKDIFGHGRDYDA